MTRGEAWRKITLSRHRSELRALDLAMRWKPLALFPIFLTVGFWWFALSLPATLPGLAGLVLAQSGHLLLGGALYIPASLYALVAVCVAAPWFFRWYVIAVALMFGRSAMASRKQAELLASITAAEGSG